MQNKVVSCQSCAHNETTCPLFGMTDFYDELLFGHIVECLHYLMKLTFALLLARARSLKSLGYSKEERQGILSLIIAAVKERE